MKLKSIKYFNTFDLTEYELNEAYFRTCLSCPDWEDGYFEHQIGKDGTISLWVNPTGTFEIIIDRIRKGIGKVPMFDDSGEYDCDGWYNFYVNTTESEVLSITAEVDSLDERNREDYNKYEIPLTQEQKLWVFNAIKELYAQENRGTWEELWKELKGEAE